MILCDICLLIGAELVSTPIGKQDGKKKMTYKQGVKFKLQKVTFVPLVKFYLYICGSVQMNT